MRVGSAQLHIYMPRELVRGLIRSARARQGDEVVVAKAIWERGGMQWEDASEREQNEALANARAALKAIGGCWGSDLENIPPLSCGALDALLVAFLMSDSISHRVRVV